MTDFSTNAPPDSAGGSGAVPPAAGSGWSDFWHHLKDSAIGGAQMLGADLEATRAALAQPREPEREPDDAPTIRRQFASATGRAPSDAEVGDIAARNRALNARRLAEYNASLADSDQMFARADRLKDRARAHLAQDQQGHGLPRLAGSMIGSLVPGILDAPFAAARRGMDVVEGGGSLGAAAKAAAIETPVAAAGLLVPEAGGKLAGRLGERLAARWGEGVPAKVVRQLPGAGRSLGGAAGSVATLPLQAAADNLGAPPDQRRSLIPSGEEVARAVLPGAVLGTAPGARRWLAAKTPPGAEAVREPLAPKPAPPPAAPALTPDEHAVAATAAGVHPDDVPAHAVAALAAHAEHTPAAAQHLVNQHASDAALSTAAGAPAGPFHAQRTGTTGEPAWQPPGADGQRGAGAPPRLAPAGQPRQPGRADGQVGGGAAPAAQVAPPAPAPAAALNRDGLPMRRDDVGLVAGMAQDGVTSVHDRGKPDALIAAHASGEPQPFGLTESHDYHERIEKAELDAGKSYPEAHRVATEAEHARMRQLGFDPNEIEALARPYLDAAAHRARALGNTTADVTGEPYQDSGENAMRRDGGEPDRRFVLDRDGQRYAEPVHGKLLSSIETVTARHPAGHYAVLDPNSAKVLAQGATREAADQAAQGLARELGRRRLQARLEQEPPLSQQQLRHRYQDIYPEARVGPVERPLPVSTGGAEPPSAFRGDGRDVDRPDDRDLLFSRSHSSVGPGIPLRDLNRAVARMLPGENARHRIAVVRSENELPEDVRNRAIGVGGHGDAPAEGFYDKQTNRIYLLADRIPSVQRAAWVIAHEGEHWGLHNLADRYTSLRNTLAAARGNKGVRDLANAIKAERWKHDEHLGELESTAEALAELNAAHRTGQWDHLNDVYGLTVPESLRPKLVDAVGRYVRQLASALNRLAARGLGRELAPNEALGDAHVRDLLHQSWKQMKLGRAQDAAAREALLDPAYKNAAAALQELARDRDLFQYPISDKTSLAGIARDADPKIDVRDIFPALERDESGKRYARIWELHTPDGRPAWVKQRADGALILDASRLRPGSGGSLLTHVVSNYAHNNGQVLIGDPAGLSSDALRRHTENMLSSALKFGTTRHLQPHPLQLQPNEPGVHPLKWSNDDAFNLRSLLETAHKNLTAALPEIRDVAYNFDHGRYEIQRSDDSVEPFGEAAFGETADLQGGARQARAGRSTLKRAALVNTLLRGTRPPRGDGVFQEPARQQGHDGLDPLLKEIFYSRAKTPPSAGSSVSGPPRSGETE